SEEAFELTLPVDGREVLLRGRLDRLEIDSDQRLHVVDLKTGKTLPGKGDIPHHPQLGLYQLAVREGALGGRAVGGAELVQLRHDGDHGAKVQSQDALGED